MFRLFKKLSSMTMMQRLVFVVCPVMLVVLVYVVVNLFNWSVVRGEEMEGRAARQQLSDSTIKATRGTIYDTNMNVLAQSATAWNVIIDPATIDEEFDKQIASAQENEQPVPSKESLQQQMASDLAGALGLNVEDVLEQMSYTNRRYRKIADRADRSAINALLEVLDEKDYVGVSTEVSTKRYYPYSTLASSVIGFCNSEDTGIYGLEAQYDDVLSGTDGRIITAQDALQDALPTTYERTYDAVDGYSIVTTIDTVIQQYIESALQSAVDQYQPEGGAAIIVMDTNTGGILGLASYPNYDLNDPYTILDSYTLQQIDLLETEEEKSAARAEARETQWQNKTITDTYEPGSVFKIVPASAALEEGTATVNSTYYCNGVVEFKDGSGTLSIHCHNRSGHGQESFIQAVVNSCNPAFMEIGQGLGQDRFFEYYQAYGLTEKTGIDLPAERVGVYYDETMSNISLASCSFGQSNTVTPLQMLTAAVAGVNGGYLLTPRVVDRVIDQDGNTVQEFGTEVKREVISEETSAIMRDGLEQVVSANGGTNASVAGYRIGGKSGTAQILTNTVEEGEEEMYVFSYFVFAPADDPQVAALALIDSPTQGDTSYANIVVGPLASTVMSDILPYLGIGTTYTDEELANQEVSVPTGLVGADLATAEAKLRSQGLEAYIIGDGENVIDVYPEESSRVPNESTIVLYTEGSEISTVTMPNVLGLTPTQASQTLGSYGLNVRISGGAANNTKARVVSQEYEAGTTLTRGTVVEIECVVSGEDGA